MLVGGLLGAAIAAAGVIYLANRGGPVLALQPVEAQAVRELSVLELQIAPQDPDPALGELKYSLLKAPKGAAIDPATGRFTWRPTEQQGPGEHAVVVRVETTGDPPLRAEQEFSVYVAELDQPPLVDPVAVQTVRRGGALTLTIHARDPDEPQQKLQYRLVEGRDCGATLDPRTGEFTWEAKEATPGQTQRFVVRVEKSVPGGSSASVEFSVQVQRPAGPVEQLAADLRSRGLEAQLAEGSLAGPLSGKCRVLSARGEEIGVFEYPSSSEAQQDARLVTDEVMRRLTKSADGQTRGRLFQSGPLLVLYLGGDREIGECLSACCGEPLALAKVEQPAPKAAVEGKPATKPVDDFDERILALHKEGKLFTLKEYPALRRIFADRFQARHDAQIQQAFAPRHEAMMRWLDEHEDVKEELFTAIDPERDNVARALALFMEIKEKFPQAVVPFGELAIAVAVVWDNDGRGVYDYTGHQHRTRSKLPAAPRLGAIENFQYVITADRATQAYGQFLPWEFLAHVVNHRTPLAERQWAVANYGVKRLNFGSCYKDVPYDMGMLDSGDKVVRLSDKEYTLANLRQYGGVCAMQADFASRVGKSLGIPAEYVGGQSSFGEGHAWVMWVELKAPPARSSIAFTLESFGRYRGDHYYVGHLTDPRTGQPLTDRQLELRLQTVGQGPQAKRHAERIMAAYPLIRDRLALGVPDQIVLLNKVIDLCPGNEAAWMALAKMSRDGVVTKEHHKAMQVILRKVFTVFRNVPDFTWKIFDDLVAYMDVPKQRNKLYEELVMLYIAASRPDLGCEAAIKYADYLVADQQEKDAVAVLQRMILAFPAEGRYVPKMLDKMEKTLGGAKGGPEEVAAFYQVLLPQIPQKRGDRASPYCLSMYQRAIERFKSANQTQLAARLEAELARLKGP